MDSPIYERLARGDRLNPLANGRRPLTVGGEVVTAPLGDAAARTMRDIERQFFHASAAALAAHGLHPYEIVAPDYRRIVYADEFEAHSSPPVPEGEEAQASADLAACRYRDFDSAEDAIEWIFGDEDRTP